MLIFFYLTIITFYCFATELIEPIPTTITFDKQKVVLGKKLFFEKKLSFDNTVSCSTCHILNLNGADNLELSFGVQGQKGTMNTPTVFNSRYNFVQFWDGRAKSLEEQAFAPIHNPLEMKSNISEIKSKLSKDKNYMKLFDEIYEGEISIKTISNAISEFEKILITPNSAFDRYLKGDLEALSKIEKEGFALFKKRGCISCHNGVNIGGNLFQKFGVAKEIDLNTSLGRFEITKNEIDKYYFKVPTLRNIEITSPYFHDGKTKSLNEAIKIMYEYQLGVEATENEIKKIEAFLKTLTGKRIEVIYYENE